MQRIRAALRILNQNRRVLAGFELIYKLVTTVILIPLIYGIFNLTMQLTGYRYLTAENVGKFLSHPLFWICPVALFFIMALYMIIDMSAVIYVMDNSWHKQRTDILATFRFALSNLKNCFRLRNLPIVPVLVVSGIVFSLSVVPGILSRLTIPDYLVRRIFSQKKEILIIALVFGTLLVLFLCGMFAFHYMTLEGASFKEAMKKSLKLGKRYRLIEIIMFALLQFVFYAIYLGLVLLELFLAVFLGRLFSLSGSAAGLPNSLILILLSITLIVVTVLGIPVNYVCISLLYYHHKRRQNERCFSLPLIRERKAHYEAAHLIPKRQRKEQAKRLRRQVLVIEWALIAVSVILASVYVYGTQRGWFNPNIEYIRTMEVTAHRGASHDFPENTMAAFAGAIEYGADWIELDVHQSKDGQIFVMHDSNFERTTGVNAYAWTKTYEEISQMDAGSFFSPSFAGERIPLLSEVLEFAKEENVRLNIEIKPSPYEEGLEENLVRLLLESEFVEQCVVTSQSYSAIEKVKEMSEEITTVYVMGFAYGNISRLEAADHFSVRASSVTPRLVARVHNAGKQIYAWTVNNRYRMDEMISRKVDNLITDNVPLAKARIVESRSGDMLTEYMRILNDLI